MKILKIAIPILIAVALAIGGMSLIKKRQEADKKLPPAEKIAITVKTTKPEVTKKILSLPYVATVKNDNEVVINTKFAGKILYIKNLGDKVSKGEIVAKIDNTDLQAKLSEINSQISSVEQKLNAEKINLDNLLKTHARTKKLLEVKMASIEQYEAEKSKIATLKAQIKADINSLKALEENKKSILNNMTYTVIKSPITGVVSAKFANKGDLALSGKPILKVASKNGNYLFITLPKNYNEIIYKDRLYPLTPLNATFNGLKTFKANIDDKNLVNGEKVDIRVVEFNGEGVFVPYDAILSINGKNYVFVVNENKAEPVEVNIKAKGEKYVLIDKKIQNPIIVAKPDILLKIKSGHPIKIAKN